MYLATDITWLVEAGFFADEQSARKLLPKMIDRDFPDKEGLDTPTWQALAETWKRVQRDKHGQHFPMRHGPWR